MTGPDSGLSAINLMPESDCGFNGAFRMLPNSNQSWTPLSPEDQAEIENALHEISQAVGNNGMLGIVFEN